MTAITHPDAGTLLLATGSKVHCDDGDAEITCRDDTDVTIRFRQTGRLRTCTILDLIFQAEFYVIE
ncbi:hypothetical protein Gbro_4709 [Gordonia bronchialis DSM 43247]|uniref:Uncharacterized protein n=1 Tax=Gordonia bronchialis (strain ATCC 25592 / DSM 43247 / BCRC 13721 / JCM 3198 / KCTC 3076 / NBRC 16047 / NCTC 10667) TaxID=526226 RepID=D0L882_GORB4|nr:hypothetical protein [Gordonia bronchialis]ACY23830.1 hypothetical protein Gbro_4709 [Gordonia bronchialis DSM 43247]MCC3321995.1 hypothetical protein [Gordonia bronchialis]QGS22863.1 hypothetical protein FOB84_00295 [Gordonia bronchialis]STQ66853.1 Uncharacterised protein [Gordonia bronchialis]